MPRPRNWDVSLVNWAAQLHGRAYAWGLTDCGSVARSATEIVIGSDPFPARWLTAAGARRALTKAGGLKAVLGRVGAEPIGLAFIQNGDILELDGEQHPGLPRLAVALGGGKALTANPGEGVVLIPQAELGIVAAWRLPA